MDKLIKQTIDLIKEAHFGQVDKAGIDYWRHPVMVMRLLGKNASIEEKLAALLHDVLEDTDYTEDDLRNLGYSEEVIEIVKLLTKDESMTYMENIHALIESGNIKAINVKKADNLHNRCPERIRKIPKDMSSLAQRYYRAATLLDYAIKQHEIRMAREKEYTYLRYM